MNNTVEKNYKYTIIARHRVKDLAAFKQAHQQIDESVLKERGFVAINMNIDINDPNVVVFYNQFNDLEKAKMVFEGQHTEAHLAMLEKMGVVLPIESVWLVENVV